MGLFIGISGLIIIALIWYIVMQNKLRQLIVNINESKSGIEVALTKRFDTLKKMLAITKGYLDHEKTLFKEVTALRSGRALNMKDQAQMNKTLDELLNTINVTVEKYPELKSNESISQLQKYAYDAEEHLQASRRAYNNNVAILNRMIVTFPISIVAKNLNIQQKEFFEMDKDKKEDIEMKF